jgi:Protein of unknown function (DUF3305)
MHIPVGVVVERRRATSAWIDHVWRSVLVLAGEPATAPWTPLTVTEEATTFYAGRADVALHRSDTSHYRDNLATGAPLLWVALRPTGAEPPYDILMVTASPAEGEALTEPGTDLVDTVPMPDPVRDALAAFVAEHHVEQVFFKRKRDSAVPERRAPLSTPATPPREDEP